RRCPPAVSNRSSSSCSPFLAGPTPYMANPSGMMPLFAAGSNSYVSETVARNLVTGVDVAQVHKELVGHRRAEAREVERAERIPFGDDGDRIGAFSRGICALLHLDLGHHWRRA